MNTEPRDPILSGLDELASMADGDHVPDRMSGISRRARANRNRKRAVGAASLVVVAAGAVGVYQLLPLDGTTTDQAPITNPTGIVESTPPPTPVNPNGLTIDLTVNQVGRRTLGVSYRIHGTSHAWVTPPDNEPLGLVGPRTTRVLLDGQRVSGSGHGVLKCKAGTPEGDFDATWLGSGRKGDLIEVPGPGTYVVTVQAPDCGPDGKIVRNKVSQTVTVTDPELVTTDETSADIDGDGQPDQIQLMMPKADREQGHSNYVVAEVTEASGQTSEVQLF